MVADIWKRCPGKARGGCGGSGDPKCPLCDGRGGWHECRDCGQKVVNNSCGCPDSL